MDNEVLHALYLLSVSVDSLFFSPRFRILVLFYIRFGLNAALRHEN